MAPRAIIHAPISDFAEKSSVFPCVLGIRIASASVTIGSVAAMIVTVTGLQYFSENMSIA